MIAISSRSVPYLSLALDAILSFSSQRQQTEVSSSSSSVQGIERSFDLKWQLLLLLLQLLLFLLLLLLQQHKLGRDYEIIAQISLQFVRSLHNVVRTEANQSPGRSPVDLMREHTTPWGLERERTVTVTGDRCVAVWKSDRRQLRRVCFGCRAVAQIGTHFVICVLSNVVCVQFIKQFKTCKKYKHFLTYLLIYVRYCQRVIR